MKGSDWIRHIQLVQHGQSGDKLVDYVVLRAILMKLALS